jgi:hypothetical protein
MLAIGAGPCCPNNLDCTPYRRLNEVREGLVAFIVDLALNGITAAGSDRCYFLPLGLGSVTEACESDSRKF